MIEITAQQAIELKGYNISESWTCNPIEYSGKWYIGVEEAHALGMIENVEPLIDIE